MELFVVTHTDPEPTCREDLLFVRIAGRLIPLTLSAVDRLSGCRDRETTAAAPPAPPAG